MLNKIILKNPSKEMAAGLFQLYKEKKGQITLNGQLALISGIENKFPIVFTLHGPFVEAEYSYQAVKRILNSHCNFKT